MGLLSDFPLVCVVTDFCVICTLFGFLCFTEGEAKRAKHTFTNFWVFFNFGGGDESSAFPRCYLRNRSKWKPVLVPGRAWLRDVEAWSAPWPCTPGAGPASLSAWPPGSNSCTFQGFLGGWCVPFLETSYESEDACELVGQESEKQNVSLERLGQLSFLDA